MILKLDDNKEIQVLDTSTITSIQIKVKTWNDVIDLANWFNAKNLRSVTLNNVTYERLKPKKLLAEKDIEVGDILVTLESIEETFEERFEARLQDLQDSLFALVEGGA